MPKFKDNVAIEALADRYVELWFRWRRGNATWMRQIPVPVCTRTSVIRQLGGVAWRIYEGFELCPDSEPEEICSPHPTNYARLIS
jgi:hypothetical protein